MERRIFFNPRKILLAVIDAVIIASVYVFALIIGKWLLLPTFNFYFESVIVKLALLEACILIPRYFLRIYSTIWRYAGATAYIRLVFADFIGGIVFYAVGVINSLFSIGLAYSVIASTLILIVTLLSRFFYQRIYAIGSRYKDESAIRNGETENYKINIVIVGAGNVGASLAAELIRNPKSHYHPYAFVDIDTQKVGNYINGVMVYADDDNVIDLIKSMPVQEVIIALPDLSPDKKRELYNKYLETDCKVKLYGYPTDQNSNVSTLSMREFAIEDLLFRETINVVNELTQKYYAGQTVLVTGGGGSIGSEVCRQIAAQNPKKLIVLDIYENCAYDIEQELISKYGDKLDLEVIIASVRDRKRMEEVFSTYRPDIVIHAAAHKHVPLMEHNPAEAIKNNVFGTYNTADMAEKYGAKRFLLISTDKAVNPTNIMGASKRLCEMIIQCRRGKTTFSAVRFGNVLGSNGSVIPLFKKQIANGGPITITDKRIIRYFMTIPEATQLVLEAACMAKEGELFVLDMGRPVKIIDLAENMIKLSGFTPYVDIDIKEVGLRPGEKLYEELLVQGEQLSKTDNDMIFIENDGVHERQEVEEKLKILAQALEKGDSESIVEAVKKTVSTYKDPDEVNRLAESMIKKQRKG